MKSTNDHRKANMIVLSEFYKGPKRFSEQVKLSASFVSQMIGPNPRRKISDKTARGTEETLNLPRYTLDIDPRVIDVTSLLGRRGDNHAEAWVRARGESDITPALLARGPIYPGKRSTSGVSAKMLIDEDKLIAERHSQRTKDAIRAEEPKETYRQTTGDLRSLVAEALDKLEGRDNDTKARAIVAALNAANRGKDVDIDTIIDLM